jgi:hypothetical protein
VAEHLPSKNEAPSLNPKTAKKKKKKKQGDGTGDLMCQGASVTQITCCPLSLPHSFGVWLSHGKNLRHSPIFMDRKTEAQRLYDVLKVPSY